jgi:hypothetical protein
MATKQKQTQLARQSARVDRAVMKRPGDALRGGRTYVGQPTIANLTQAATTMLIPGCEVVGLKKRLPFVFVQSRRGRETRYITMQLVGGLTYLPGNDEMAAQAFERRSQ